VFAADIARTGWYGFPALDDGTLKIGHHGRGFALDPSGPRVPPDTEEPRFRAFLARALPSAVRAPLVASRLCFYCDTADGDFWIDHDPLHPGLVVAAGGSGHAFKFLPVLGAIVADVIERRESPETRRFRWREAPAGPGEAARARG
jgi:glycine/D-amino acid oxidase-like deaminating enzyme